MTELSKIAVIGATGFVGRHLHRAGRERDPSCIGTSRRDDGLATLDLRSPDIRGLGLAESGHTHAAITAAVSGVAECEREPERTRAVNLDGTLELVRQLEEEGVAPILFSSDYVFDGEVGGYADDAPPAPIVEYGRQKAALEAAVGDRALLVRLGKVHGTERGDDTLLDEMAAAFAAGRPVRAAGDQVMTPVQVEDAVAATLGLVAAGAVGVVNVCGPEVRSRVDLARALAAKLGAASDLVEEISLDELGEGLIRPKRTDMVAGRLLAETDVRPAPAAEAIAVVAANYSEVRA